MLETVCGEHRDKQGQEVHLKYLCTWVGRRALVQDGRCDTREEFHEVFGIAEQCLDKVTTRFGPVLLVMALRPKP